MSTISQPDYTTPHDSCATCDHCRKTLLPRTRVGLNAGRFCSTKCHDAFWNETRRGKQSPPTARTVTAGEVEQKKETSERHPTTIRRKTKIRAIAAALCRGERLDCFSAVRLYHDFVLRSTISELSNRYGVEIIRTPKTVPGYSGSSVDCVEYRASEDGAKQLARLLGLDQTETRAETL